MHFAVVSGVIPNMDRRGSEQTPWLIIKSLLDAGHRVTSCIHLDPHSPDLNDEDAHKRIADLRSLGVDVITVPFDPRDPAPPNGRVGKLRRILAPTLEEEFPSHRAAPSVISVLKQVNPDGVLAWDHGSLAATDGLTIAPRMAALGSLPHTLQALWWRLTPRRFNQSYVKFTLRTILKHRALKKFLIQLLSKVNVTINLAAEETAELQRIGVPCLFTNNLGYDFGGPDWKERRKALEDHSKLRVLLIGRLNGTFTKHGLHLLADEILPVLERTLGPEKVEVRIVGSFSLPDDLEEKLRSPIVNFCGWVEDADTEYLSADVLLVSNPVELGLRTRILAGFATGCCVVAHEANLIGTPELVPDENIVIAKDGTGLAQSLLRVLSDQALRERLGANGRRTFEDHFSQPVTGGRVVAELERMVREHKN